MAILFISQGYLKDKSIISNNADFELIKPVIDFVQDMYVRRMLGTNLFNTIAAQVNAYMLSATPIPANYKTLLDDYILKSMIYYIEAEAVWTFKFRYMNKGVMVKSSDNSQPISDDEAKDLYDKKMTIAEMYANDLERRIIYNPTLYPEYFNNNGGDQVPPKSSAFECDLYLPTGDPDDYRAWKYRRNNGHWEDIR